MSGQVDDLIVKRYVPRHTARDIHVIKWKHVTDFFQMSRIHIKIFVACTRLPTKSPCFPPDDFNLNRSASTAGSCGAHRVLIVWSSITVPFHRTISAGPEGKLPFQCLCHLFMDMLCSGMFYGSRSCTIRMEARWHQSGNSRQ